MSDQCLKCNHFNRPDMCAEEDCSIKKSWYVLYLTQQIAALKASIDKWERVYKADMEANLKGITVLTHQLNSSEQIREAEKKILLSEIEKNAGLIAEIKKYHFREIEHLKEIAGRIEDHVQQLEQIAALTEELKKFQAFCEQSRLTERVSFIRAYRETKEATSEPEN